MKSKLRWRNGWPQLTCPTCGEWMGWLGQCFWICGRKKCHQIWVGIWGVIGDPWQ